MTKTYNFSDMPELCARIQECVNIGVSPVKTAIIKYNGAEIPMQSWIVGSVSLVSIQDMIDFHGFSEEQAIQEVLLMLLIEKQPQEQVLQKEKMFAYQLVVDRAVGSDKRLDSNGNIETFFDDQTYQPIIYLKLRCAFV